jgi:hypothetical protein
MSKSNLTSELPRYVFVKVLNLVREPCPFFFEKSAFTVSNNNQFDAEIVIKKR